MLRRHPSLRPLRERRQIHATLRRAAFLVGERLRDDEHAEKPEPAAVQLAREARRAGLNAHLELSRRALRRQLSQADKLGARYVAIVAEQEPTSLREMDSGQQHALTSFVMTSTTTERPMPALPVVNPSAPLTFVSLVWSSATTAIVCAAPPAVD